MLYTYTLPNPEYSNAVFSDELHLMKCTEVCKEVQANLQFWQGRNEILSSEIARKQRPTLVGVLAGLGLHRRCLFSPHELTSANSAVTDGRSTALERTAIAGPWRSFLPVSGLHCKFCNLLAQYLLCSTDLKQWQLKRCGRSTAFVQTAMARPERRFLPVSELLCRF